MIVMVYRTYEAGAPALLSLSSDFTDEQFVAFVKGLTETVRKLQDNGYDRTSVTVTVLGKEDDRYINKLDVEI